VTVAQLPALDDLDSTDPTPGRCVVCDSEPATAPGVLACRGCRLAVAQALDELPSLYVLAETQAARLGELGQAAGTHGRGAPGFKSRTPGRDDVLVLLDRRRTTFDPDHPRRPGSVMAMLAYWLDEAEILGWPSVAGCCSVLHTHLDRLVSRWWFGDFAAAVTTTVEHLRRATSQHEETIPIGACPTPMPGAKQMVYDDVLGTWEARPIPCGGQVRARSIGDSGRCGRCGKRWEGVEELRALGRRLGDPLLDLPGLSRMLGISSLATLRSWAHRDGWRRQREGRRTLYSLADARESAYAAWDRRFPVQGCEEVYGPRVPPGWRWTPDGWRNRSA